VLQQLLVNGLAAGSICALPAVSLAVVYRSVGFFDFTQAAVLGVAGYAALAFAPLVGPSPILLGIAATVAAGFVTGSCYGVVVAPLHRKQVQSTILLLASIGVFTVVESLLILVFGSEVRTLPTAARGMAIHVLADARLSPAQIASIIVAVTVVVIWCVVLRWTRFGLRWRALASDEQLALSVGVRSQALARISYLAAGCTTGLAGVLQGYDTGLAPSMGFGTLLIALVAVVVGRASVLGAALSAVLLAELQQFVVVFAPAFWQHAIVFIILVAFLFLRGREEGKC
jgi:branched-chain amino acid transport system permease protein